MITGIQVPKFKILKGVDVPILERLTVVVGPNGSGKSTLLSTIKSIHEVASGLSPEVPSRRRTFIPPGRKHDAASGLPPNVPEIQCSVKLNGLPTPDFPRSEAWIGYIAVQGRYEMTATRCYGEKTRIELMGNHPPLIQTLLQSMFLKLSAEASSRVSYNETATPSLGDDGANLASVIGGYLKRGRTDIVEMITSSLKSLVPQILRVWVENASLERDETEIISVGSSQYPVTRKKSYWGERLMFDTRSAKGLPAHEMSEGTLLATALLTLLHGENPPNLLLMDDIDKGLHPRAIASLVEILKGIMEQRPELQIIATTHSPYLLDQIPIESVICMHVAEDGYARAKPLTDHPEYDRWKGVMTAGEFWSTMGEEWVTRDEAVVVP